MSIRRGEIDRQLRRREEQRHTRRGGTDLVATMARRVASRFAEIAGVALTPLPYDAPPFGIDLLHSRRATADPALRWFLATIERVGRSL